MKLRNPFLYSAIVLLALSPAYAASVPLPDTPPGKLMSAWVTALNAGDRAALTKFIAENYSASNLGKQKPEMLGIRHASLRRMVGGELDAVKVTKSTDKELMTVFCSRADIPMCIEVRFELDDAGKIARSGVGPEPAPAGTLGAPLTAEELGKDLDARLSRMAEKDQFSGAVLIAKDGKPVFQKAYGLADRDAKTPNTLDTRFRLGSMPKMFTSVAIAQLVQAGKFKYTDTLAQVLPDYPNKEIAQKITIHQLLTHTSGLGDIFTPEFDKVKDQLHDLKDYLPLFVNQPLQFEPGKSWSYSNAGFIVLGLIIEKQSGQSYYDDVQQHIYKVAGMKSTGAFPKTEKVPNLAVGYTAMGSADGTYRPNWDTLPYRGMSAGGMDSTVGDMLRFANALRDHKLLNAELTQTVITGKVDTPRPGAKYAYGFENSDEGSHHIFGHSGGAPGMNGDLGIYDDGYTVVVLSNLDPPAAQKVSGYIAQRLK